MTVTTRTYTHHVHTLTIDDEIELELTHKPAEHYGDHPLVERVGDDTIVVGYLVDDSDCANPMENADCQGKLYTRRERVITDNESEVESALGLSGGEPQIHVGFHIGPERVTLMELAIRKYAAEHPELDLDNDDVFGEHEADIESTALGLYAQHWQAIAGPYVVPISYFNERGFTKIYPTTWDGDYTDRLPDGVWVADDGACENIDSGCLPAGVSVEWTGSAGGFVSTLCAVVKHNDEVVYSVGNDEGGNKWGKALAYAQQRFGKGTEADLHAAAVKYAEGVLKEYASWCEGDCYGRVIEVFEFDEDTDSWEANGKEHEACWGFIGSDYAKEELDRDFKAEVEHQRGLIATSTNEA